MTAEEEHESLLALANKWLKKSDDLIAGERRRRAIALLKVVKGPFSGIFDANVITDEAQVYRECARNLKKLIGEL